MPLSFSSTERANPPPRRKSCTSCIKAKRRCDLRLPACLRCTQRTLECRYPVALVGKGRINRTGVSAEGGLLAAEWEAPLQIAPWSPRLDVVEQMDLTATVTPALQGSTPPFDPGFSMLDYIIDSPGDTLNTMLAPPTQPLPSQLDLIPLPSSPVFPSRSRDAVDAVAIAISTRLQYAIGEIVTSPKTMVFENQTPWCHPHLYRDRMPRSMQDALACCGLYAAKNHVNAFVIMRTIESRVQELVSSPLPTARLDLLARTHALLLYQIIRLFDGDIRARGAAERTNSALEAAVTELLIHIRFDDQCFPTTPETDGPLNLSSLGATREFWEEWIFQESARRTFLITFFTLQMYRVQRGDLPLQCDAKLYLCHSWTISAPLWGAVDSLDFEIAWKEKNHFVVTNANISDVIRDARADDVDSFGKILITSMMGIDETKRWLFLRGGTL